MSQFIDAVKIEFKIAAVNAVAAKRPPGYVEDFLSAGEIVGDSVWLSQNAVDRLRAKYARAKAEPSAPLPTRGPGTELKKLLALVGIQATTTCSCNKRAKVMDDKGPEWCEANEDEILGWLREEATKRKLPFVDLAGRLLIRRAIRNARKAAAQA